MHPVAQRILREFAHGMWTKLDALNLIESYGRVIDAKVAEIAAGTAALWKSREQLRAENAAKRRAKKKAKAAPQEGHTETVRTRPLRGGLDP